MAIYFVNAATGNDSNDGQSWATALKSLNNLLLNGSFSKSDDSRLWDTIRVAQGTYELTGNIFLGASINLIGGYKGILDNEDSNPDEFKSYITRNSGCFQIYRYNSESIPLAPNNSVINGFTFKNNIHPLVVPYPGPDFQLINCVFESNINDISTSGSAVSINPLHIANTVTIENCKFVNNQALNATGGAIHIESQNANAIIKIKNCEFINNKCKWGGGAISNTIGTAIINCCKFFGNSAHECNGGAIISGSLVYILNSIFYKNSATTRNGSDSLGKGGAIYINCGISIASNIINCTFYSNTAESLGGSVCLLSGELNIMNSILFGSSPKDIDKNSGTINLSSCIVDNYHGVNSNINPVTGIMNYANLFLSINDDDIINSNGLMLRCSSAAHTRGTNTPLAGIDPDIFNLINNDIVDNSRLVGGVLTPDLGAYQLAMRVEFGFDDYYKPSINAYCKADADKGLNATITAKLIPDLGEFYLGTNPSFTWNIYPTPATTIPMNCNPISPKISDLGSVSIVCSVLFNIPSLLSCIGQISYSKSLGPLNTEAANWDNGLNIIAANPIYPGQPLNLSLSKNLTGSFLYIWTVDHHPNLRNNTGITFSYTPERADDTVTCKIINLCPCASPDIAICDFNIHDSFILDFPVIAITDVTITPQVNVGEGIDYPAVQDIKNYGTEYKFEALVTNYLSAIYNWYKVNDDYETKIRIGEGQDLDRNDLYEGDKIVCEAIVPITVTGSAAYSGTCTVALGFHFHCNLPTMEDSLHIIPIGIGGGGALFSPSINPFCNLGSDPSEMFLASDMSGLFRSDDGGNFWHMINFRQLKASRLLGKVHFVSSTPVGRYALGSFDPTTVNEGVLMYSVDGVSWGWNSPRTLPTTHHIDSLMVNPVPSISGDQIIIGFVEGNSYEKHLYISNNNGVDWHPLFDAHDYGTIIGSFFDGDDIYICTESGILHFANGLWDGLPPKRNGIDSGTLISFSAVKDTNLAINFFCLVRKTAINTQIETTHFYSAKLQSGSNFGDLLWAENPNTIFGTINNGSVFMACSPMPAQKPVIYLHGVYGDHMGEMVWKSADGGSSWSTMLHTKGTDPSGTYSENENIKTGWFGDGGGKFNWGWPQPHGLTVINHEGSDWILFTDDGFAHLSKDNGESWKALYIPNYDNDDKKDPYNNLNAIGLPVTPDKIYKTNGLNPVSAWWYHCPRYNAGGVTVINTAGLSDILLAKSTIGGDLWKQGVVELFDPDISYNTVYNIVQEPKFAPNNRANYLYAAASQNHDIFVNTVEPGAVDSLSGAILFSDNLGSTWKVMATAPHPIIWIAIDDSNILTKTGLYVSILNQNKLGVIYHCADTTPLIANLTPSSTPLIIADEAGNPGTGWEVITVNSSNKGFPFNIVPMLSTTNGITSMLCSFGGTASTDSDGNNIFNKDSGLFLLSNGNWNDISDDGMRYRTMDVADGNDQWGNANINALFACVYNPDSDDEDANPDAMGKGGLYRRAYTKNGDNIIIDPMIGWQKIFDRDGVFSIKLELNAGLYPTTFAFISTQKNGLWYSPDINDAYPQFYPFTDYPFARPTRIFGSLLELFICNFGGGIIHGQIFKNPNNDGKGPYLFTSPDLHFYDIKAGSENLQIQFNSTLPALNAGQVTTLSFKLKPNSFYTSPAQIVGCMATDPSFSTPLQTMNGIADANGYYTFPKSRLVTCMLNVGGIAFDFELLIVS